MIKVLIAVPTFETIDPECFKSIYGLQIPAGVQVQFNYIRGYDCARARNLIAKEAVKYGFDFVLMIDSDTVVPSDALKKLLSISGLDDNILVRTGWQLRKRTRTGQTEIFDMNGKPNYDDECNMSHEQIVSREGPFQIKGCGMGCALIDVKVFAKIFENGYKHPFKYVEYDDGGILSEDTFFCTRVREVGGLIYCHPGVRCGHINKITF